VPLDDGRSVGFWGVLGAGAVAAVVVGVLFWPTDEPNDVDAAPSSTESASASSTEGGGPTSSSAATTGPPVSDSDAPGATDQEGETTVTPKALALVEAGAVVTGLGEDARFFTEGYAGYQLDDEPNRYFDPELDFQRISLQDASCTLVNPFKLDLSADLAQPFPDLNPDGFTAGIRADQFNRVSIGATEGTVVGGFAIGDEGRDNSRQWEIHGGSLVVELDRIQDFVGDSSDPFAKSMWITATWTGMSTENFTGEEAEGSIMFTCLFVFAPDRLPEAPPDD
jgi:hypothetical protein